MLSARSNSSPIRSLIAPLGWVFVELHYPASQASSYPSQAGSDYLNQLHEECQESYSLIKKLDCVSCLGNTFNLDRILVMAWILFWE